MTYKFKELYSGGGDGGIIEVDALPTENIDENVFYLVGGKYYRWHKTGTWVFKDNYLIPNEMLGKSYRCGFSVNTPSDGLQTMDKIALYHGQVVTFLRERDLYSIDAAELGYWYNELYKSITITEMPTDEIFLEWLRANAREACVWYKYVPTPLDDDIIGTWVFDDELSIPDEFYGNEYHFKYSVYNIPDIGDMEFTALCFYDDGPKYIDYRGDDGWETVYQERVGWFSHAQAFKTIEIQEMPDDEAFITWLRMSATKSTSDIVKLEDDEPLPTAKNANTTKLYLKNDRYYRYTIQRTDTGSSVYVFNDNIGANGAQELMNKTYYFEYSVNIPDVGKVKMTEMTFEFDGTYLVINYNNNDLNFDEAYNERNGWANEMLKTIEIHEMPDDETFKDWLFAEAVVKGTWVEYAPTPVDDSVVGTWVFKETIEIPSKNFEVEFTSNGSNYVAIEVDEDDFLFYSYEIGDYSDPAFTNYHGWETQSYRTIKITEESTDATFISWLKENATKQASTSTGATAHTVQSVDELPSDAIDGSMALVESSGSYSLYIRKNGEWVYGGEANMSGGTGGENYQTCEIAVTDQDCCGPYKVTYKAYENGSLVDKDAVVQNGGTVTINAVQGEEMFIEIYNGGSSLSGVMVESDGEYIDVESRYENGGLYTTVPSVSECYVFICG